MQNTKLANDLLNQLAFIRSVRKATRKQKTCGNSILTPYRAETVELRKAGASLFELQQWLKSTHRIAVARSTISRFLSKLPELADG